MNVAAFNERRARTVSRKACTITLEPETVLQGIRAIAEAMTSMTKDETPEETVCFLAMLQLELIEALENLPNGVGVGS
jgi:hypothetical protein